MRTFSWSGRAAPLSVGIGVAAYLIASGGAVAATAFALWRVGAQVLEQLAAAPAASARRGAAASVAVTDGARAASAAPQSVRREGAMSLLAERGYGASGVPRGPQLRMRGFAAGGPFGASSRSPHQSYGYPRQDGWWDGDDDERPPVVSTYRTLCVRLCDGYYFPVSFAVTPDRLDRDRHVCAGLCGAQGRLFVHRSLDTSADDMVDLAGRPYRDLPTAFLYRTEYVASCKCQPEPWDAASLDRHRSYVLAAAARKGNKDAAKELRVLQAKMKEDAKVAGRPPVPAVAGVGKPRGPAAAARQAETARREDGNIMLLGGGLPAKPGRAASSSAPLGSKGATEWVRRTFDPGYGGR
jgi:hypothetical protein